MSAPARDVSGLLAAWNEGDPSAQEELLPLVYDELRRLARGHLRRERPGHTLQPTALVHEAYLRLVGEGAATWQNRAHFYGIAARLMRQILINHAEARATARRGGGALRLSLSAADRLTEGPDVELMALDDALKGLSALDPRQGQIVEMRFFGGLSVEETAEVLGLSPATVKREWSAARAWLRREIDRRELNVDRQGFE
jgi:RNA polymerase sigma factor (TIGR02999 family)